MAASGSSQGILEVVQYEELDIRDALGKGWFGMVYVAIWRSTRVAVKMIESETAPFDFWAELRVLSYISHPNIIRLYGACQSPVCLIVEFAECGSLFTLLHGPGPQPHYNAGHGMSWCLQCAAGIAYLHGQNLIHRDLKPHNLRLTSHGVVLKICNLATAHFQHLLGTDMKDSAAWTSPEVFEECELTNKCDVFSWGIIFWEVLTRRKPFGELGGPAFRIHWAIHTGARPNLIQGCPAPIEELMTSCWSREPDKRPSMSEVVDVMTDLINFFPGGQEKLSFPSHREKSRSDNFAFEASNTDSALEGYPETISESSSHSIQRNHQLLADPSLAMKQSFGSMSPSVSQDLDLASEQLNLLLLDTFAETPLHPSNPRKSPSVSRELANDLSEVQSTSKTQIRLSSAVEYDASSFTTSANQADVVGTGSYGVVRRCYHDGLRNVVIKCIHCGGSIDTASKAIDVARKKIRFLTRFKHPHIVQIYGITAWSQCFGIIMEEVKCGNLSDLMVVNNHIKIGWKLRYTILHQLADALNYLHFHNPKKSYVHLDVKPENILLTLNLSVKLADFGSLEIAIATGATSTTTETSSDKQYTPLYTAPERLLDICDAEAKSSMDVYSFAMVCYEVITRQAVFQDVRANVNLLINLIGSRGQKPNTKFIDNLEEEVKNQNIADLEIFQQLRSIMEKCWCFEPENRLSMKEVLQRMMKFAGCENPYESDVKSNADLITRTMSQNQKAVVSVDKKVPLKLHFPPFYQIAHLVT